MSQAVGHDLSHLSPAASRLGAVFARPKLIAVICVIGLASLGWFTLALQAANIGWLEALCRPLAAGTLSPAAVAAIALMWGAMTLAMMLPSAGPMILTYAEIADTAARKNEAVVSPFVLAGGYLAVWFAFAAVATMAQIGLTRAALIDPAMATVGGLFSGAVFIGAGAYQFSALKQACLKQCRNPFPFFFTNWATTPRGVFRLGLRQGLFCLGCCWAMMAVMFAVGVMNVAWMAALGIVMTLEKLGTGQRSSQVLGLVLIAIGGYFVLTGFAAHWPGQAI